MSNEIDFKNIYKFLAGQINWANDSDADKDTIVTKNEFISYINTSDWDTDTLGNRPSNDIIGNFFSKELDDFSSGAINDMLTNKNGVKISDKNALSSKDIEDAEKTIARERIIIEQCKRAYDNCPYANDPEMSTWKSLVADLIEAHYVDSNKTEALEDAELQKIIVDATAQVESQLLENAIETCKASLPNKILEEYPHFAGYNLGENSTFMEELETYITNNKAGWKSTDVETKITEFIGAYLDGDINGNEEDGEVLNEKLFTYAVMNGLKTTHTSHEWTNEDGTSQKVSYSEYPAAFEAIFKAYINEILNSTENPIKSHSADEIEDAIVKFSFDGRIEALKDAVKTEKAEQEEAIAEANRKTKIKNLAQEQIDAVKEDIYNTYESFSTIIEELVDSINISDVINLGLALNEEETGLTYESKTKIQNYVKEKILAELENHKAYNNGYDGDNKSLIDRHHENRINLINYLNRDDSGDDDIVLQATKDAHIDYCAWLYNSGNGGYKNAVIDVYTNDYRARIDNATDVKKLEELFNKLKTAIEAIIDPYKIRVSWQNENITVNSGENYSGDIANITTTQNGAKLDESKMSYTLEKVPSGLSVTIDSNGNLTFTAPRVVDKDTNYTFYINALYDGTTVFAGKEFTITVKKELTSLNDVKQNVAPFGTNESIADILAAEEIGGIELSGFADFSTAKANAKTNIAKVLTNIGNKLKDPSIGFDAERVNWAVKTTINYYQAAIDKIYDVNTNNNYDNDNVQLVFEYEDASGKTCYSENDAYFGQFTQKRERGINITEGRGMKRATNSTTGLRLEESWASDVNTYTIGVNKKALLLKLNSFLEAFTI